MRCEQELCPNWSGGSGCVCAVLDIEPPSVGATWFDDFADDEEVSTDVD